MKCNSQNVNNTGEEWTSFCLSTAIIIDDVINDSNRHTGPNIPEPYKVESKSLASIILRYSSPTQFVINNKDDTSLITKISEMVSLKLGRVTLGLLSIYGFEFG